MDFEALDWARLDRLRTLFLAGKLAEAGEGYWRDAADLAAYDATFGERIGWKWDAVVGELALRRWTPPTGCELWDWGCGSGTAGRRLLAAWPGRFTCLRVTDHSPLAREFAVQRAAAVDPMLPVSTQPPVDGADYVLCVSHVMNELSLDSRRELLRALHGARAVLWVEPGTHAVARELQMMREQLLAAAHQVVAPCTHQAGCGLLQSGNEAHWCHHFADPPSEIFANSDWVRFGQRAGLDLRALPYAFLVTEQRTAATALREPTDLQRILGWPRVYKGYARALLCGVEGVAELEVPQRVAPVIYKAWNKRRGGALFQVQPDSGKAGRIATITPWPTSPEVQDPGG